MDRTRTARANIVVMASISKEGKEEQTGQQYRKRHTSLVIQEKAQKASNSGKKKTSTKILPILFPFSQHSVSPLFFSLSLSILCIQASAVMCQFLVLQQHVEQHIALPMIVWWQHNSELSTNQLSFDIFFRSVHQSGGTLPHSFVTLRTRSLTPDAWILFTVILATTRKALRSTAANRFCMDAAILSTIMPVSTH